MNAPSISRFASPFLRGLVGVVALSAVFTFLWSWSVPGSGFAVSFLIFGGFWFLIVTLQSCVEPMLVLKGDGLVVRRWASRLSHIGHGRRYPVQVLDPVRSSCTLEVGVPASSSFHCSTTPVSRTACASTSSPWRASRKHWLRVGTGTSPDWTDAKWRIITIDWSSRTVAIESASASMSPMSSGRGWCVAADGP